MPPIHPSARRFLFLRARFEAFKDKKKSAPKGESEGQRGFQNASGAASVGNIPLDYASDAPALDLIFFNICLRVLS